VVHLDAHALCARRPARPGVRGAWPAALPLAARLAERTLQVAHGPLDRRAHLATYRLPVRVAGALGGALGVLLCLLAGLARGLLDLVAQLVKLLLVFASEAGTLAALPLNIEVTRGACAHRIRVIVSSERTLEAEVRPARLPTPLEAETVAAKRGLPG